MTRPGHGRGGSFVFLVPLILAGLSMLGPFSIDTPFPAFPEMADDFHVTGSQMQLVVSAYLIAFGVMSPFHGPLSDALGRRPVILAGVAVYVGASIGCALSTNLEMLLAFRVLQGLSAGGGVIVSRTVIRDVYSGPEAQRLMSRVMMIFAVAPAVAPVIGGLLLQVGPWPITFWFMAVMAVLLIVLVAVSLPETHPAERRTPLRVGSLVRSLLLVTRHAAFHRVAWAAALSFAGQFIYIGSAPIFVVDLLGRGELDFWMFFVPMIGGVLVGSQISSSAAGRISSDAVITGGLTFGVLAVAANVVLAVVAGPSLPWAVIGPALVAVGTASAYPSLQLVLLDMFPGARGSAVSMFTFFTLILNGLIAGLLAPLVTGSVVELALASAVLVLAGLLVWLSHLAVTRRKLRTVPATQM